MHIHIHRSCNDSEERGHEFEGECGKLYGDIWREGRKVVIMWKCQKELKQIKKAGKQYLKVKMGWEQRKKHLAALSVTSFFFSFLFF